MLSETLWIFLTCFVILYYILGSKRRSINLPGPRGIPYLGNALQLESRMWVTFNKWSREYGPLCKVRLGPSTTVLVSDNKIAKEMLALDAFMGRANVKEFNLFEGENIGLISSEGEVWEEQRRFVVRQLRDLGFGKSSMESRIMEEVNELIERIGRRKGEPLGNVKNELSLALTNSLWSLIAGTRYRQDDPKLKELHRQVQGAFEDAAKAGAILAIAPWVKYIFPEWSGYNSIRRAKTSAANFVRNAINEHKKDLQEDCPRDLIDVYLIEIKKTTDPSSSFYGQLGEKQLIGVVEDFFEAGTDTTSTTMTWAILHLLKNPEIQRKLQTEIDLITGGSRQVSFSDRNNMPYTQAVINELLRISIVPFGAPHSVLFDTEFRGIFFPKNTAIMINMHYIHHDPRVWNEPDEFKPERFLSEDGKSVKKVEGLNPFLVGRRQCPGESLAKDTVFLFLTNLVQKFDILPDPNAPEPDMEPAVSFTVQPKPYSVIFREREDEGTLV